MGTDFLNNLVVALVDGGCDLIKGIKSKQGAVADVVLSGEDLLADADFKAAVTVVVGNISNALALVKSELNVAEAIEVGEELPALYAKVKAALSA